MLFRLRENRSVIVSLCVYFWPVQLIERNASPAYWGQGQTTGFTLDSLLKLNTAKAFDKKTSILHYLVMLARRNDPTLLDFKDVSCFDRFHLFVRENHGARCAQSRGP